MTPGDLVYICPDDPTVGVYVSPDPQNDVASEMPEEAGLLRSMVLFDGDIYSIPTFQLEVIQ